MKRLKCLFSLRWLLPKRVIKKLYREYIDDMEEGEWFKTYLVATTELSKNALSKGHSEFSTTFEYGADERVKVICNVKLEKVNK